eukprot:13600877-Alexandrium_andersonii.AAC.1
MATVCCGVGVQWARCSMLAENLLRIRRSGGAVYCAIAFCEAFGVVVPGSDFLVNSCLGQCLE